MTAPIQSPHPRPESRSTAACGGSNRYPLTDAVVAQALKQPCKLGGCRAQPGHPCTNAVTGQPMPDRTVHFYRIEPQWTS